MGGGIIGPLAALAAPLRHRLQVGHLLQPWPDCVVIQRLEVYILRPAGTKDVEQVSGRTGEQEITAPRSPRSHPVERSAHRRSPDPLLNCSRRSHGCPPEILPPPLRCQGNYPSRGGFRLDTSLSPVRIADQLPVQTEGIRTPQVVAAEEGFFER